MTNVRPGMLAISVGVSNRNDGRIFEVISEAPDGRFTLPDGSLQSSQRHGREPHWILKAVGGPAVAPLIGGRWRPAVYGIGSDQFLRPLPGDTEDESMETECSVPQHKLARGDGNG